MPPKSANTKIHVERPIHIKPSMSDEAVLTATNNNWNAWFSMIDKAGGMEMTHQEIVKFLAAEHGVGPWWRQMVTVTYEQARGKREKHEKKDGFQISVSKTFASPAADIFSFWTDARRRASWIDVNFIIRKATKDKTLRITWPKGARGGAETTVEVQFYNKGGGKCQMTVQHNKLADAKTGEAMKAFWKARVEKLKNLADNE